MSATAYTQQQLLSELRKAEERIKPAKLADTQSNGLALSAYLKQNNLEPTAANFYNAVNALVASLKWTVKPAKLVAAEQNERPQNLNDAAKGAAEFTRRKQAAEVADAKAKADATIIRDTYSAILAYTPIDSRGRVVLGKQSTTRELLQKYVAKEVAGKKDAASIREQVVKYIAKLYADDERALERL
jgi:hypothetical protein